MLRNLFESPSLLQREPRPRLFHLHAHFQKERVTGLQELLKTCKALRKCQEFLDTGHVLNRENGPARALFRTHRPRPHNQRGNGDFLAVPLSLDLIEGDCLQVTQPRRDRKSTRLNSSHLGISYAVFCLKKKKITSNKHTS